MVSLETAGAKAPVPVLLPEVPGVADDALIVDIWMNDREVFVEYPHGLFVTINTPDPGATTPVPSMEQEFTSRGGMVTDLGGTRTLYFRDARVAIVSLEDAYSSDELTTIEDSIATSR